MKQIKIVMKELRSFLILWSTQSFSALGSSMTSFALIVWSYQQQGSALATAMLSVCSYVPYIVMSIFAGALSDQWNKKATMLVCDTAAALCSLAVLFLLQAEKLEIWHLYGLNAINGFMNTVQQPASDVVISLLTTEKHYQKVSGMRSFSSSLTSILTPVIATMLLTLTGIQTVILFDLVTFIVAFIALVFLVKIPEIRRETRARETVWQSAKEGLRYLRDHRGILDLILFLAAINLVASVYHAAFPAMLLSREGGSNMVLGIVNAATGLAMVAGSVIASLLPAPKSRVRVICNTLLLSMSTENFLLAFGRSVPIWCVGAVLGWIGIPIMNANMDVLFRKQIPIEIQGRVFSTRNALQFFTIPIGYFLGGVLVDRIFEPFMAMQPAGSLLTTVFGTGKGTGAALLFFLIAFAGMGVCLVFRRSPYIWKLEESDN